MKTTLEQLLELFESDKVELIMLCKTELGYTRTIQFLKKGSRFTELEDWLKDSKHSTIQVLLKDQSKQMFYSPLKRQII
jgi:hypothetical protein